MATTVLSRPRSPRVQFTEQALWYVLAGTCATLVHAGLFLLLRGLLGPFPANLLAIVVTATANVEFHHHVTFRNRHETTTARRLVAIAGTVAYDATYSSAALLLLELFVNDPTATQQTVVIVAAAAAGGIARFLLLRGWVFRPRR